MFVGDLSPEVTEYMLVVCVIAANCRALCEDVATKTEKKAGCGVEVVAHNRDSTKIDLLLALTHTLISSRPRSKNDTCPADRQRS